MSVLANPYIRILPQEERFGYRGVSLGVNPLRHVQGTTGALRA